MAKSDKTVKRGVYLYIDGKEIKNDINSIDLEVKRLQRDIKDMTRGSEEYNRTMQKIQHLKGILREHRNEIRGVTEETKKSTISVGKLVDGFNRFGGIIVTVIGFLTGVTLALRSFRDERNKLEESQAGLKALTGLDDDSIAWLTRQAKQLSTTMTEEGLRVRQSASEILDAYMLVGSAKPELLGNKEALAAVTEEAMRLQAAAKDIKLSEAVDALTLSLNQYGAAADQAGRFANVLAAGSKEGAANIASQARTIRNAGVAAASANVSIEQTVGLIETLAEKGIKDEVAGTGLKKFFLVLQTGADETNPKIVGLNQALDNLAAKNMGAKAIKDMFGEEGYNVASVIMQDIDKVKQYTAAVTDTNIAYEQAAINSNTAAAALDQARNKMKLAAIELGEKLNPAFTVSTNLATNLLKVLPDLIDWLQKNISTVTTLAVVILALTVRQKASVTWTQLQVFWNEKLMVSMKSLFAFMRANPYTFIIAGAALLVSKLVDIRREMNRVTESQKSMQSIEKKSAEEYEKQAGRIKLLSNIVHNNNIALHERRRALDKLKEIVPKYNADLNDEGRLTNDNTEALKDYLVQLERQIKMEAAREELVGLYRRKFALDRQSKTQSEEVKAANINLSSAQFAATQRSTQAATSGVRSLTSSMDVGVRQATDRVNEANMALQQTQKELRQVEDAINDISKLFEQSVVPVPNNTVVEDDETMGNGTPNPDKFAAAEAAYYQKVTSLKKQYLQDGKMTQEEYLNFMTDLELKYLNEKLQIAGVEPKKREEINNQILDLRIKLKQQCVKEDLDEKKQILTNHQKELNAEIQNELELLHTRQISREDFLKNLAGLQKKYKSMVISETEDMSEEEKQIIINYLESISNEFDKAYSRMGQTVKDWSDVIKENWSDISKWTEISKEQQQAILSTLLIDILKFTDNSLESLDSVKDKYEAIFTLMSGIAADFGTALGETLTDSEDAMGEYLKNLVIMVLDTIQKLLVAYISMTTMRNVSELGLIGLAKAAAEIALITAAFETAKGAIGNFYTGGFTPSGDWDQPQGLVHSNEFVANRFAVANPHLRPIFDVIDVAQRSGNVANLTADDIAAVARGSRTASAATSPAPATAAGRPAPSTDPELLATLAACTRMLRKLDHKLDLDINAVVTISGRNGVKAKLDEYETLLNNKKRK